MKITFKKILLFLLVILIVYVVFNWAEVSGDFMRGYNEGIQGKPYNP